MNTVLGRMSSVSDTSPKRETLKGEEETELCSFIWDFFVAVVTTVQIVFRVLRETTQIWGISIINTLISYITLSLTP